MSKIVILNTEFNEMNLYSGVVSTLKRECAEGLAQVAAGHKLFVAGALSEMIDTALDSKLVVRSGMAGIGIEFISQEGELGPSDSVSPEMAAAVFSHIQSQAQIFEDKLSGNTAKSLGAAYAGVKTPVQDAWMMDPLKPALLF